MSRAIRSLKPLVNAQTHLQPQPQSSVTATAAPLASASASALASQPDDATNSAPSFGVSDSASDVLELKSASRLLLDSFDQPGYTLTAQLRLLELQLNNPSVTLDLNLRGRRRRTLLMQIIQLHCWSELRCAAEARRVFAPRSAHVQRLIGWVAAYDVHAVDEDGNNALHVLAAHSVPNLSDPHSFGVQLVAALVARGIDVDARGEGGRTAVNQLGNACGHAPATGGSIAPLLLQQYGADATIPDRDGNLCGLNLVRQLQWRLLEQITTPAADAGERAMRTAHAPTAASATSSGSADASSLSAASIWHTQPVLRFMLHQRNHAGENAFECALRLQRQQSGSRDTRATAELMQRLQRSYNRGVRAQLQSLVQEHVAVKVLADLVVQYCDASGRPFSSEEQQNRDG